MPPKKAQVLSAPVLPEQETRKKPPDVVSQALGKLSESMQAQWRSGGVDKLSAEQTDENIVQECFNAQVRVHWTIREKDKGSIALSHTVHANF